MSFLSWIDFDQSERERARQIMDLFREEESRDELGIGSIRDGLADLMFPGTSTIQTRLRYMLFVPWIYRTWLKKGDMTSEREARVRKEEVQLIHALARGGETRGVIGREARAGLKRLPSDVYWSGLGVIGIRRFHGSRRDYLDQAPRLAARGDTELMAPWSPGLPKEPDDLLETATFRLTGEEADFIVDRLASAVPDSLFAALAGQRDRAECKAIWLHPDQAGWSQPNREIVRHARLFSQLMHGAALLYNLMLSERVMARQDAAGGAWQERTDGYRIRLGNWHAALERTEIAAWQIDDMLAHLRDNGHRVPERTMRFVDAWRECVLATAGPITDVHAARWTVELRERQLKGRKSRFQNPAALARWGGASGTEPLRYRWTIVQGHLRDLADAA